MTFRAEINKESMNCLPILARFPVALLIIYKVSIKPEIAVSNCSTLQVDYYRKCHYRKLTAKHLVIQSMKLLTL